MKTPLMLEIEYDPSVTDPESLAAAMGRLLETACSTPGIFEDYGNPTLGAFTVAEPQSGAARLVLNVSGGVLQDVFCSCPDAQVVLVDWDTEGREPSENGLVRVKTEPGRSRTAYVTEYPFRPLDDLVDTDAGQAVQAAGITISPADPTESDLVEMCRRVAGCAENRADCSDMKEALTVFKELGQECRALLTKHAGHEVVPRYILFDFDSDELATTNVYDSYREAAEDASQLDNVIVLTLPFEMPTDGTCASEEHCECEEPGYFCSGVAGILAHLEDGCLAKGAKVERCDACCLYPNDEAALAKLIELGIAHSSRDARPD